MRQTNFDSLASALAGVEGDNHLNNHPKGRANRKRQTRQRPMKRQVLRKRQSLVSLAPAACRVLL